jgi:thymidylate synthase (FAD)
VKVELFEPPTGTDLTVVNAARVSFDKRSEWELRVDGQVVDGPYYQERTLKEADKRLIQFLARGMTTDDFEKFVDGVGYQGWRLAESDDPLEYEKLVTLLKDWRRTPTHFTPFAHPHVSFRIEMPIALARQLEKHQVGFVWSEVSRRYVDAKPEFYRPETWRKRAENIKQGSSDEGISFVKVIDIDGNNSTIVDAYESFLDASSAFYERLIEKGVCPEQARFVLPQAMMTEWIWTGSLYGWANVFNQRKPGSHAQRDVWPFAESLAEHMSKLFPVSWEALTCH